MPDFAPLGAAHAPRFARGKGRHVVVEEEVVFILARQRVNALRVALGAQRGHNQRLRFAAREQRRAVRALQNRGADFNGAHGACVAPVNARLARQDAPAHNFRFQRKKLLAELGGVHLGAGFFFQLRFHGSACVAQRLRARLLAANVKGGAQLALGSFAHGGDEGFVARLRRPGAVLGPKRFARLAHQLVDGVNGHPALLVAEHHRAQHHFFAQLARLRLHHQHCFLGAGDDQVKLAALARRGAGVEHIVAVDVAHARRANGAVERNAADGQRRAHANHGGNIGVHLRVERERVHHHVHFVEKAVRKQRADGAVNQAAGERFQLARLGFALEKAAGNLAGGVSFFNVINGEREKILPRLGLTARGHCRQHRRAVNGDHHGARGLARDFARFQHDRLVAPLESFCDFVEHAHGNTLLGKWRRRVQRCHSRTRAPAALGCGMTQLRPNGMPRSGKNEKRKNAWVAEGGVRRFLRSWLPYLRSPSLRMRAR